MSKLLIKSALLTFIFVTLFGLNLSMQTHADGKMSNCPFMVGQSSMCQMPAGDHILKWQQMFVAIPQFSYFLFLSVVFFVSLTFLISQFTLASPNTLTLKAYKTNHPENKLFNNLLLAFSDGIIHPKIYN